MGQKDITERQLEAYNDVFADIGWRFSSCRRMRQSPIWRIWHDEPVTAAAAIGSLRIQLPLKWQ